MIILRPTASAAQRWMDQIEALQALRRLDDRSLEEIQFAIRAGLAENFDRERAGGQRWAALAPSTVADRIRQGYGGAHPILRRSDDLATSYLDPEHSQHVSDVQYVADLIRVKEGSGHPLARYHEQGTRHMPARPITELDEAGRAPIRAAIENWILQTLFFGRRP